MAQDACFNLTFTVFPDASALRQKFEDFMADYEDGNVDIDEFHASMSFRFASSFAAGATVEDLLKTARAWDSCSELVPENAVVTCIEKDGDPSSLTIQHDNVGLFGIRQRNVAIRTNPHVSERERLSRIAKRKRACNDKK